MLTHGNLVANVRQVNTWYADVVERGKEIIITALPLYHVYALTCNCLCYVDLGGRKHRHLRCAQTSQQPRLRCRTGGIIDKRKRSLEMGGRLCV